MEKNVRVHEVEALLGRCGCGSAEFKQIPRVLKSKRAWITLECRKCGQAFAFHIAPIPVEFCEDDSTVARSISEDELTRLPPASELPQ